LELKTRYVVVDSDGTTVLNGGDSEGLVWMHSTAKPIQLLPFLERELDLKYSLTAEELVLLASSHLAQPQHIEAFLSILRKTELAEEALILPPASPHGRISYRHWLERREEKRKRYHPCAGNHAAIMLLQRELTGAVTNYESIGSTAQQEILQFIKAYAEVEPAIKRDNCGIPTYGISLRKVAAAYQRLAASSSMSGLERFVKALHSAPVMIEGDGCISTILCSSKDLIAKTGANYLLAIGSQEKKIGLAIIAKDGWEAVTQALCVISAETGVLNEKIEDELKRISY